MRDLHTFLAAIDPLRKLEVEWRALAGFESRLTQEVLAQQRVDEPTYRRRLHGRILAALAGVACPDPGHPGANIETARLVCEDHGEEWPSVLASLVEAKLLRRATTGELSISGPGHHCAIAATEDELNPGAPAAQPNTMIFARLDPSVRRLLGAFKVSLSLSSNEVRSPRSLPAAPTPAPATQTSPAPAPRTPRNDKKHKPLSAKIAAPPLSRRELLLQQLKRAEASSSGAPMSVLNLLHQAKAITNWTVEFAIIEDEPRTIWRCDMTLPEVGNERFSGIGHGQREARADAAGLALAAWKQHVLRPEPVSIKQSPKDGDPTRGGRKTSSNKRRRPWPASLLAKLHR